MSQNQSSQSSREKDPVLYIIKFFSLYGDDVPLDTSSDHTSFSFYGEGTPNDELQILDNDTPIGTVTVNPRGRFDAGLNNLKHGSHAVKLRAPTGQESFPWRFSVDTSRYPWLDRIMDSNSNIIEEESATTNEDSLAFYGRAEAFQTLRFFANEQLMTTVHADYRGIWRALLVDIKEGKQTFKLETSDGKSSAPRTLLVELRPALPDLIIKSATDSGGNDVPHGGVTSLTTLSLKGKARPNEGGFIYTGKIAYAGFQADDHGDWMATLDKLNGAIYFFKAKSDIEGRTSTAFAVEVRELGA